MGVTKRIGFEDDINNIAEVFKALGHPARIQIMNILLSRESCSCGNIVEDLPLAQSTVSNHLLELKKANLVNITFSGKSSIYSVEKEKLNVLNQFISNYIDNLGIDTFKKRTLHKTISISDSLDVKSSNPTVKNKKSASNLKKFNYVFKHKK
jgi:ArsR family transcriptional regulator, arsenate/arsenite/antimonite-responsive transcriptional repressor